MGNGRLAFRNDLSGVAVSLFKTESQIDSLTTKLNDHQIFRAATDHYIELTLPRGDSLEYKLGIFRDSKTYTFEYTDRGTNFRKNDDDDAITLNIIWG